MEKYDKFKTKLLHKMNSQYKTVDDTISIASRTYFSWKGLVILSQNIFIKYESKPTIETFQLFYKECFKKAKKINKIPLFRGMQFGYMIIPLIVTNNANDDIIEYTKSRPNKRFSIFEYPVLYDLENSKTYYYTETPIWGAFLFSDLRSVIEEYIV